MAPGNSGLGLIGAGSCAAQGDCRVGAEGQTTTLVAESAMEGPSLAGLANPQGQTGDLGVEVVGLHIPIAWFGPCAEPVRQQPLHLSSCGVPKCTYPRYRSRRLGAIPNIEMQRQTI